MIRSRVRPVAVMALVSGVVPGIIYNVTLAPTVSVIDSGELAAVACTLGIAHPTGYPLFTLLGWAFSHLPVASTEIVRLNLMAALLCAAGVGTMSMFLGRILAPFGKKDGVPLLLYGAAGSGAVLLGVSRTYWEQALSVEVYSLHMFLVALVLLTFHRCIAAEERREASWWVFAFVLGLGFANHMTMILLAPGLLYWYFAVMGNQWKPIGRMVLPFLAGLSVYLYLPLRASQHPTMNWGDPTTWGRLFAHLRGKQYSVWLFSSMDVASHQLAYFWRSLPGELSIPGLLLSLLGVIVLMRGQRKTAIATLLLFLGCVAYSINYDIHDIDSYFLLAYIVLAVWAGVGMYAAGRWLVQTPGWKPAVVVACMACVPAGVGVYHYNDVDESRNYLVDDYTHAMFASLPRNAVVLSYQWDYWVSASYYYQLVKGEREDLTIIDKELLRRSWYLRELRGRFPWLMAAAQKEVDAFSVELNKFERGTPYDPETIQARFEEMVLSFIHHSMTSRAVFVTQEIEPEFTRGLHRVPTGLAFRLVDTAGFLPSPMPVYTPRRFDRSGRLESMFPKFYASSLIARGAYYLQIGRDTSEARQAFAAALDFDPSSAEARMALQMLSPP